MLPLANVHMINEEKRWEIYAQGSSAGKLTELFILYFQFLSDNF